MVQGQGLDARVGERNTEIKGRIRATFGTTNPDVTKPDASKPGASKTDELPSAEAGPVPRAGVKG